MNVRTMAKGRTNRAYPMIRFAALALLFGVASCAPKHLPNHLAIASQNSLSIVEPMAQETLHEITRYREVMGLAYRPDGERLAVVICARDRIVELETADYTELGVLMEAASCPWDLDYSPDGSSLAATIPVRPDPAGALFGHLRVVGPNALDRSLGIPLPAVAYRPGGVEIAVGTPQGLMVYGTGSGYPAHATLPEIQATSLGYTIDGSRLIAGTPTGFAVLDVARGYTIKDVDSSGKVVRVAVDPTGSWVALVRVTAVSLRRAPDLAEVATITTTDTFSDADFSSDGALLAVAESRAGRVRLFRTFSWEELDPIAATDHRLDAVAFRPQGAQRIPVLFIHGHSRGSGEAWFEAGTLTTSFAAVLAVNPDLSIDAFYLELPLHGDNFPQNQGRSIAEDAQDILAVIEGGPDSRGAEQVGILNLPAYQSLGRVAIIAYSQGTISARYYLKHLMGTRRNGAITVSEFVALAAPNHGVGGTVTCGDPSEPDRARRQLCGGLTATLSSQLTPCGACDDAMPPPFTTNMPGDETFFLELNGQGSFAENCAPSDNPDEAPRSRPSEPEGVLYVNLYAEDNADLFVGGDTQSWDCVGRRLARNLSPDTVNLEIPEVPWEVHSNFPHHWPTICVALRTVVDHQAPASVDEVCEGLVQP
jgi:hypothetical protein